ncbi:MAG: peptidylprolyl isomerase [Deltaproteobacteria bacterium]|nr:peptidylprolyl isomerase [Deltaproteobacteria bacterium]
MAQSYIEAAAAEEAQKYYNENKQEFERVELAHILVPTIEKANGLIEQIKKGADFFETAKKESQDKISQPQGGRLGMVGRNEPGLSRMGFEPILEQAFTAKIGEVAGPIKTTAGYHVILVTSPIQVPLFDEVKGQLMMHKKREIHDKLLSDLKTSTKIVYADAAKPAEEKGLEVKTEGQKAPAEAPHDHPHSAPTSEPSQP